MFIDVSVLERRKVDFDQVFLRDSLSLPESWKLEGELHTAGTAELLDRSGSRTIRVRGHIEGAVTGICARCLEEAPLPLDGDFDLFFHPMSEIARAEQVPIDREDTWLGFYEDPGMPLAQVVSEQVVLWLPMRCLCQEDCRGICPHCGVNRNRVQCQCREKRFDSRWDALRSLHLK